MSGTIRILGVDPGLRRTGWGMIAVTGNTLSFLGAGTVKAPLDGDLANRLAALHIGLTAVVVAWTPDEAAVEQTFVNRDAVATLKLGQARGIALLVPAQAGLAVAECGEESNRRRRSCREGADQGDGESASAARRV